MPCRLSRSRTCCMTGLLTIGTIGLGRLIVSGRSREPSPPAMTTAFIPISSGGLVGPGAAVYRQYTPSVTRAPADPALFEPSSEGEDLRWRGRPCWLSIDLEAIEANVRALRARLRPGAGLMAVVKANAYGHGIVGIAEAALAAGAWGFGVAAVEEGAQLRSAGVDSPILVLGYVPHWEAERVL